MSKVIVSDTGPLIALALIELLPVLSRLFSSIYVPDCVVLEATHDMSKPGAQAISDALEKGWLIRRSVSLSGVFQDLAEILDQGEAEALSLAEELNAIVLVDERQGRKVATKRGISITGTAAILIKAKKAGEITAVKPLLDKLTQSGYRLSRPLISDVLKLSGESIQK